MRDVRAGGLEEGGSTLTQQLARTLFLTAARGDWMRKGKEAVLALMIEQRLSKQQILELYLNRIYLGGNVYGVEAMSQNVFGRSAAELTLSESAFIAGLIRMPSGLWPWSHYDRAVRRSHVVLARMRAEGFITAQAEQQARATPPRILADPGLNRGAGGYAQDYLRQQFKAVFENDNPPDWKVQTTFVPALQREAERAVTAGSCEIPAGRTAGRARRHRSADGRRARACRRTRLRPQCVQSGDQRRAPAGIGLQTVSLRCRARKRHVADFAALQSHRPRARLRRMGSDRMPASTRATR